MAVSRDVRSGGPYGTHKYRTCGSGAREAAGIAGSGSNTATQGRTRDAVELDLAQPAA